MDPSLIILFVFGGIGFVAFHIIAMIFGPSRLGGKSMYSTLKYNDDELENCVSKSQLSPTIEHNAQKPSHQTSHTENLKQNNNKGLDI